MDAKGHSEPADAVLSGDTVPPENHRNRAKITAQHTGEVDTAITLSGRMAVEVV